MIHAKYKLKITSVVLKDAKIFHRGKFLLTKIKQNNRLYSRVGVVLSRKTSSSAVVRNNIKRVIYRFFQENKVFLDNFNPPSDFLIIILAINLKLRDNKEDILRELKDAILI